MRWPVTVVVAENEGGPKQPPHAWLAAGVSSAHDTDVAIAASLRAGFTLAPSSFVPESLGSCSSCHLQKPGTARSAPSVARPAATIAESDQQANSGLARSLLSVGGQRKKLGAALNGAGIGRTT
jgi:hypothetical protein